MEKLPSDGEENSRSWKNRIRKLDRSPEGGFSMRQKANSRYELEILRRSNRELKETLELIPDWYWKVYGEEAIYVDSNNQCEVFIGYKKEEIIGKSLFDFVAEDQREGLREAYLNGYRNGKPFERYVNAKVAKNGELVYMETSGKPIFDENKKVIGCVGIGRDVSQRVENDKKIEYLLTHDALTGVYNRAFFDAELERLIRGGTRSLPASLIILDIFDFKRVNDTWGHKVGDNLLIRVCKRVDGVIRGGDILGRLGGDEFGLLLPETNGQQAQDILNRFPANIRKIVSCGLATASNLEELRNLFKNADNEMYKDKRSNRAKETK